VTLHVYCIFPSGSITWHWEMVFKEVLLFFLLPESPWTKLWQIWFMIGYFFFKDVLLRTQFSILELYFGLFACVSTFVQRHLTRIYISLVDYNLFVLAQKKWDWSLWPFSFAIFDISFNNESPTINHLIHMQTAQNIALTCYPAVTRRLMKIDVFERSKQMRLIDLFRY
jgi:hypothetical protein